MASEITIALEGPRADVALEQLLALEGVQGRALPLAEAEPRRDFGASLVVVGAIVSIVSGVATVVDKIIAWRTQWLKDADNQRLSMVMEDGRGNRLVLNEATPEQIAAALKTLAQ